MKEYTVSNIYHKCRQDRICVKVPGSKSITNRALLLATLANGKSTLKNVLFSDDSRHFLQCIQDLGFDTKVDEENKIIQVTGLGGRVPKKEASIYVGSAGTAARFLSAYLGVSEGVYHLDASAQMRKRPMAPLLKCLNELGCEIESENPGFFPFALHSHGFGVDRITVDIGSSSQFLSALMIAMPLSDGIEIEVEGTHGLAYIHMTQKMMEQFGVSIENPTKNSYKLSAHAKYQPRDYMVEPDVSAACYFYAMAPLLGIQVLVPNVHFDSMQGDVEFLRILEKMGCALEETEDGVLVKGPENGEYEGITCSMNACSDQAITLAAIAPFAKTPTKITGIGHIRLQESDRMKAIVTELTKMGITCSMGEDWIEIIPGEPKPARVETYEDHRMAMGFSLVGLRVDGIVIDNPECCKKTFENYFEVLDHVISELTL